MGASYNDVKEEVLSTPKRKIRNSYGCKGRSKEKVELNVTQIREPRDLQEALLSSQADEWM